MAFDVVKNNASEYLEFAIINDFECWVGTPQMKPTVKWKTYCSLTVNKLKLKNKCNCLY